MVFVLIQEKIKMEAKKITYNHSLEEKKFKKEWAEKAEKYRKAGMTKEQTAEIYNFDLEIFNSDH